MDNTKEYIKWLINFTNTYSSFSDDEWLYYESKLSKENIEKVNSLHLLYNIVDRYATDNYIYPNNCEFGNYYKINSGNVGFEIGVIAGQGVSFFCNRVELENKKDFIDFNDILNNKESINKIEINEGLEQLSYMIDSLYKKGVPFPIIFNTVSDTVNELSNQNNSSNEKTLKRKMVDNEKNY